MRLVRCGFWPCFFFCFQQKDSPWFLRFQAVPDTADTDCRCGTAVIRSPSRCLPNFLAFPSTGCFTKSYELFCVLGLSSLDADINSVPTLLAAARRTPFETLYVPLINLSVCVRRQIQVHTRIRPDASQIGSKQAFQGVRLLFQMPEPAWTDRHIDLRRRKGQTLRVENIRHRA